MPKLQLLVFRHWSLATNDQQQMTNDPKGFTLIELMVAIMIIGIVSAIGLTVYSKAQVVARDSRRKEDLRSVATALELYYQQNNHSYFSTTNTEYDSTSAANWPKILGGTANFANYINQMPLDPKNSSSFGASSYAYAYNSPDGSVYYLCTRLENVNDKDINISGLDGNGNGTCLNDGAGTKWGNFQIKSQ